VPPVTRSKRKRPPAVRRRPAPPRIDIASIRRDQIVDAATDIIASRGIQHLSLSAIESETGMSRGQLTYYFKTKEDILLAVFDRTVARMQERMAADDPRCDDVPVWRLIESLLARLLTQPIAADFAQLQYSFLAQTRARPDYRERLADLYDQWRTHMANGIRSAGIAPHLDPRLLASFVQALLHGLVMQLQADPQAFDGAAMLQAAIDLLGRLFAAPAKSALNGRSSSSTGARRHG
jgi:AcrR family transcriptional regulator